MSAEPTGARAESTNGGAADSAADEMPLQQDVAPSKSKGRDRPPRTVKAPVAPRPKATKRKQVRPSRSGKVKVVLPKPLADSETPEPELTSDASPEASRSRTPSEIAAVSSHSEESSSALSTNDARHLKKAGLSAKSAGDTDEEPTTPESPTRDVAPVKGRKLRKTAAGRQKSAVKMQSMKKARREHNSDVQRLRRSNLTEEQRLARHERQIELQRQRRAKETEDQRRTRNRRANQVQRKRRTKLNTEQKRLQADRNNEAQRRRRLLAKTRPQEQTEPVPEWTFAHGG